ncbi:MAG: sulfotransferase family protein [Rhodobacteraceae bacterium]|nr:sulfotransferase family protein [Paracoccaceae bacterium]
MISHKHRCIFIHIPKCAGTSIEAALGHHDSYSGIGTRQDHRPTRLIERPIPPKALLSPDNLRELIRRYRWQFRDTRPENKLAVTSEQFRSYYKFTIVRNPWSRAYSWYQNVIRDTKHLAHHGISEATTFAEFMSRFAGKGMLKPQIYWLKGFDGTIKMDFVGRFENLSKDYRLAAANLAGNPPSTLPHEIHGQSKGWRSAYDQATSDLVAKVYAEDIKIWGYEF